MSANNGATQKHKLTSRSVDELGCKLVGLRCVKTHKHTFTHLNCTYNIQTCRLNRHSQVEEILFILWVNVTAQTSVTSKTDIKEKHTHAVFWLSSRPQSLSPTSTGCHIFTTLFIHPHASFLPTASLLVFQPVMPGGLSLTSALWLTGGPAEAQHSKGISGNTDISNPWLLKALRLLSSSVWQLNRREIRNKNTPLLFTLKAPER